MRRSERGFTLVEIVAALVLLGIVAIPLAKLFMDSFKFQAKSQSETEAMKVAQFVAEQLKDGKQFYGLENMELTANKVIEIPFTEIKDAMGNLNGDYEVTVTIGAEKKGQEISGSTPVEYAYEIETDGELFRVSEGMAIHDGFSITCSDFVIQTSESDTDTAKYDILIVNNEEDKTATFQIDKRTTAGLNIYTKGKGNVILQGYPYNRLSKKYTSFEKFNLGEKSSVSSKSEDLYDATVNVVSKSESGIDAMMNTTFTIGRD